MLLLMEINRYIAARILGRDIEVIPSVLPSSMHRNTKSVSVIHIDSMDWGNE